ncbi:hypothetical protein SETIT_8G043800v2 [Setaria italica]|uniref:Uncharacterized protein n=1 Tax=Setaria italica TaxID=4555 RepID=A0A368S5S4_SETIT|nr:hypothetical protein SETIT_8G043800v2 [Setaria italica]
MWLVNRNQSHDSAYYYQEKERGDGKSKRPQHSQHNERSFVSLCFLCSAHCYHLSEMQLYLRKHSSVRERSFAGRKLRCKEDQQNTSFSNVQAPNLINKY